VHYLLNIAYGITVVSTIHGAAREPSLALALVFGLVTLQIAFAMLTVLLSHLGLGALAWIQIFGGSLIGTSIALYGLSRRHPLAARVRHADDRQPDQ
jgi:CBS domain containing-hemolysin-like protein